MGARCPFYGFRWPDRTTRLVHVGGDECALDLDENGPCKMQMAGRTVSMHYCEIAEKARPFIDVMIDRVRVYPDGASPGIPFSEWRDRVMTGRD